MKKIATYTFFLSILIWTVYGCKKKSSDPIETEEPTPEEYDRVPLLTNLANNYIIPAYVEYKLQVADLKSDASNFNTTLDVTSLLALRNQWEAALLTWQDVAFLELGPAATISLRAQTNVYPVDTSLINSNITSGTYNLQLSSNFDAKGFQAIDYLINGKGSTDTDIVNYFVNTPNARTYLTDVINEMESNSLTVDGEWRNTYVTTFIANSASNAQGSAVSDVINSFVQHYETYVRKGKIGLPAGVFNVFSQDPLPEHVEALYFKQSLPFVHRSLVAIQKFIKGESYTTSASGEGLDDYMSFVAATTGGQPLEQVIDNQLNLIQSELSNVNDPLSSEVTTNNQAVRDLYQEMQKLVPYLKIDMTNALDVLITYQDNDGD